MNKMVMVALAASMCLSACGGSDTPATSGAAAPATGAPAAPATSASMAPVGDQIGRIWHVEEAGWIGTWTRRGDSSAFDAVWTNPGQADITDEVVVESMTGKEVVLFRKGVNGRYRAQLSADGTKVEAGTADWFPEGLTWTATIEK